MNKEAAMSAVGIDEMKLDRECVRLPTDYLRFAHMSADAKRDLNTAENRLKAVEADVAQQVRETPARFGLEKVTEAGITAAVRSSKEYVEAMVELGEARHAADIAQAAVWALEFKKRSVTLLVELHGMSYYSNPKISEQGRKAVDEQAKRATRRPITRDHNED